MSKTKEKKDNRNNLDTSRSEFARDVINKRIADNGWNKAEFVERVIREAKRDNVEIAAPTVYAILNGRRNIQMQHVPAFARSLGMSQRSLFPSGK